MTLRIPAASAAGAVTLFVLGYLIFGILIISFMQQNTFQYDGLVRERPDLIVIFLSNLVMALMLAIVFEYWSSTRTFVGGLKGGTLIGFFVALSIDVGELGYMNLYRGYALIPVDVLAETVRTAIAGGVIGWVLGLMKKRSERVRSG